MFTIYFPTSQCSSYLIGLDQLWLPCTTIAFSVQTVFSIDRGAFAICFQREGIEMRFFMRAIAIRG